MGTEITNGIHIDVRPAFKPEHSVPEKFMFVFSYKISILNQSAFTVQLISRHWTIIDSNGYLRHVDGDGVIGIQPIIPAGESHTYESACDLRTDIGTMSGYYIMENCETAERFKVRIPTFQMEVPFRLN